jgi:UDP-glucose 4-epimerase
VQLGSLIPKRDLTYIDDTVEAFIKVAQHDNPVTIGEIYNCGCGKSVSVGGLAELIISGIGNVKPIVNDPERMRSNDVYHLEADSSKIFQDVGWEPQVSLDDGLKATAKWWKQRMGDLKQEAKYVI